MKYMQLLGLDAGQSKEAFATWYLGEHANALAAADGVTRFVANLVCEPTAEMIDAGWGWGGNDDSGIVAIDEVWVDDDQDILSFYATAHVIGSYRCNEIVIKSCGAQWPLGEKSHWVKRMGLLKCFDDQRPEDFHQYWQHIHAPKALKHHIGAGIYVQNHFVETIKAAPTEWNGSMSLDYWNVDAFRFGHFSQPDSAEVIKEDGSHFMDQFKALYAEEYVMKR